MHRFVALLVALLIVGQTTANPVVHQDQQSNVLPSSQVSSQTVASPVSPVVGEQAPVQAAPVVGSNVVAAAPVESHHTEVHHEHQQHHAQVQHSPSSYYAPAALMQVVGAEQPVGPKPVVRSSEQYGQPESTGLPPNYKPFGSWGLYIGGNPADGYYTNYYKALSNSVDKQAVAGEQQVKPVSPVSPVSSTAALSPVLRQASTSPYVGGDYFPFAYAPSDLSSATVGSVPHVPVQYSAPVLPDNSVYGVSPYADLYAAKKLGSSQVQKDVAKEQVVPLKGQQQSRVYVYPSGVGQLSAPVVGYQSPVSGVQQQQQQQQTTSSHHQVVAYPVPVGSQIVGSQAGVDGAFAPYGVHAFTRYAVKPTVVSQEPSYSYSYQTVAHHAPVYRQHVVSSQSVPAVGSVHYPVGYYGYPVNQLHYSSGSGVPVPVQHPSEVAYHGTPVVDNVVVERVEGEESKPQFNKPQ